MEFLLFRFIFNIKASNLSWISNLRKSKQACDLEVGGRKKALTAVIDSWMLTLFT